MESLKTLYKIGHGPSSSHTMAPGFAASFIKEKYPNCSYVVTLYGSLSETGKGHLTDKAIIDILGSNTKVIFSKECIKCAPCELKIEVFDKGQLTATHHFVSVGGGELKIDGIDTSYADIYPHKSLKEIIAYCKEKDLSLPEYVDSFEQLDDYLEDVIEVMQKALSKGLFTEGILPGGLNVERKASLFYARFLQEPTLDKLIFASSLALAEENAAGGLIVTAPTCGSCAILPAVVLSLAKMSYISFDKIKNALKVAGIIGNLARTNASISGAMVGCQGEVGVASSMASAAYAYLKGGTLDQIEYAAEIALEHHLGLTCDPVDGLVQIPCIERNAISAIGAKTAAEYALISSGTHKVSFDEVVSVMMQTGVDLNNKYKETAQGGLARRNKAC